MRRPAAGGDGAERGPRRPRPSSDPVAGIAVAAAPARVGCVDDLDRAGALEPAQRRIQRAERDAPEGAEHLAQALLQLVAVEGLLLEQAEDGQLQHVAGSRSGWPVASTSIYRRRYIERSHDMTTRYDGASHHPMPARRPGRPPDDRVGRAEPPRRRFGGLPTLPPCPEAPTTRSPDGPCCAICAAACSAATTSATPTPSWSGRRATSASRPASDCPVCRAGDLYYVSYVYGEGSSTPTGAASRTPASSRSSEAEHDEFDRYVVEVCTDCRWNHLGAASSTAARPSDRSPATTAVSQRDAGAWRARPPEPGIIARARAARSAPTAIDASTVTGTVDRAARCRAGSREAAPEEAAADDARRALRSRARRPWS